MKYQKRHTSKVAMKNHVSRIKARGGKVSVSGNVITYEFSERITEDGDVTKTKDNKIKIGTRVKHKKTGSYVGTVTNIDAGERSWKFNGKTYPAIPESVSIKWRDKKKNATLKHTDVRSNFTVVKTVTNQTKMFRKGGRVKSKKK